MRHIPTMCEVREMLWRLNRAGMRAISKKSGVPLNTIIGIRHSPTRSAEWDTVRGLLSHFDEVVQIEAHHSRQYRAQQDQASEHGSAEREAQP